jgi:hypothetical protein
MRTERGGAASKQRISGKRSVKRRLPAPRKLYENARSWPHSAMALPERAPLFEQKIAFRNRRKAAVSVRLEPWGDSFTLAAGETVQLVARGPEGGELEIVHGRSETVVYAWPGAVVIALRRGFALGGARETAPRLPPGMSTREWVDEMSWSLPATG